MRDLWWTKWRWGRFSANLNSTNFSTLTLTLTYHSGLVQQPSSGRSTGSPTPRIKKRHYSASRKVAGSSFDEVEVPGILKKKPGGKVRPALRADNLAAIC
jgi:hypothetical protein